MNVCWGEEDAAIASNLVPSFPGTFVGDLMVTEAQRLPPCEPRRERAKGNHLL